MEIDLDNFQLGPFEVTTFKNPKKSIQIPDYKALQQLNAKDGIASIQYWFCSQNMSDQLAVDAILKNFKPKQICFYGRSSTVLLNYELILPPLTKLRLNSLQFPAIPPAVLKNTSLISLNLSNNLITELPPQLAGLINLKQLFLTENKLSAFPLVVIKLVNLEKLDINFNQIPQIPESIGQLKKLNSLAINYNHNIKILPKVIYSGMKNLKTLALAGTLFYESAENKSKISDLKRRGILIV